MSEGILHVVTDPSFMDFTADAFEEVAPGANTFVAVDLAASDLRVAEDVRVEEVKSDRAGLDRLDALVAKSQIAIFHCVKPKIAASLASAPSSVLRVWSGWGADYYGNTLDANAGLLGPETRSVVGSGRRPTFWASQALHAVRIAPVLHAASKAADVFSAPIPDDFAIFRKRFTKFDGRYSQLNYVSVEDSIATGTMRLPGPDILLGNAAAPVNNHLEMLKVLASQDLSDRRVLAPLSYGDSHYASVVASAGRELLGDRFVPITEFLPLDAYHELVADCGIVMIGAYRQLALGNILRAIWQGAHVALDTRNPVAGYLRRHGVSVILMDDIQAGGLPGEPPTGAQLEINKKFLDDQWSRSAVIRNIDALISLT